MKVRYSKNAIRCSFDTRNCTLSAPHERSPGFAYIALLAAIVIIGISLGAAAKYWSNMSLRDKEQELLYRGDQYRKAIEHYSYAVPGRTEFPQNLEDLLQDNRSAVPRHHLRRKYKDPITGEDFVEIRDQVSRRIIGVNSPSDKEPLKKSNFPNDYKDFEGKKKYNEWKFVYLSPLGPLVPGQSIPQRFAPPPSRQ